jgi:hypothetical protein
VSPSGEPPRYTDPPDLDEEFRRVAVIAASDDLVGARTALRRLADRAEASGRRSAASRALRLSAALDRVLGDIADAVATARRAAELAGAGNAGTGAGNAAAADSAAADSAAADSAVDHDLAAAALDELGEALIALDHAAPAADAFRRAADHAAAAGLASAQALRRKQAYALSAAGRAAESAAVLRDLAGASTDPAERAEILVQAAAGAAGTAGARDLWIAAREALDKHDNRALRADLAFVAAAEALQRRDLTGARAHVRAARQHALDGVAPLAYVAAAVAESSLAEHAGDDEAAYGSLATGYATLGDLVGKQLSASTFEGPLLELRKRWGPARFTAAKTAYETTRRRAL